MEEDKTPEAINLTERRKGKLILVTEQLSEEVSEYEGLVSAARDMLVGVCEPEKDEKETATDGPVMEKLPELIERIQKESERIAKINKRFTRIMQRLAI